MTTHKPEAQPDYRGALGSLALDLHDSLMTLAAIMDPLETASAEWQECYRASQALHLACELASAALSAARERDEPVPYLPADADADEICWRPAVCDCAACETGPVL